MDSILAFLKLFIHQNLLDKVCKQTNHDGRCVYKGDWKKIEDVEMNKFIGPIIRIVYKSTMKMFCNYGERIRQSYQQNMCLHSFQKYCALTMQVQKEQD